MTQKEQMLRFIQSYAVVSEDALLNRFGLSAQATFKELSTEVLVALNKESQIDGPFAAYESIPDTWHITSTGVAWLKDMDTERRLKQRADWWTRGLAIAALLMSLIAILK